MGRDRDIEDNSEAGKSGCISFFIKAFLVLLGVGMLEDVPFGLWFVIVPVVAMIGMGISYYKKNSKIIEAAISEESRKLKVAHNRGTNQTTTSENYNIGNEHDLGKSILSQRKYGEKISISQEDFDSRLIELKDLHRAGIIERTEYKERVDSLREEM